MRSVIKLLTTGIVFMVSSCAMHINDSDHDPEQTGNEPEPARISFSTSSLFPFRSTSNWWCYSEEGGNLLTIAVTDTISDDGITFYRVSFVEQRRDTTDDWFQSTLSGIEFGSSLTGSYSRFLPARVTAVTDTFTSRTGTVRMRYFDHMDFKDSSLDDVIMLEYLFPVIHGFDRIYLADSIGIIRLIDYDSRWPIEYNLDSCRIGDEIRRW